MENSKVIKVVSWISLFIGLALLGAFFYNLAKENSLITIIAFGVSGAMAIIFSFVLNPPKVINKKTFSIVMSIILFGLSAVTIIFFLYALLSNDAQQQVSQTLKVSNALSLVLLAVFALLSVAIASIILRITKQDINVDEKYKKQKQAEQQVIIKERAKLTKCKYCSCSITKEDVNCPNCKSKL